MPAREQLGIRSEHRVDRSHFHPRSGQLAQGVAERRLERPDVEDHTSGTALDHLAQDLLRCFQAGRHDNEVVIQKIGD